MIEVINIIYSYSIVGISSTLDNYSVNPLGHAFQKCLDEAQWYFSHSAWKRYEVLSPIFYRIQVLILGRPVQSFHPTVNTPIHCGPHKMTGGVVILEVLMI